MKLENKDEQDKIINKFKEFNKIGDYNIVKKNGLDGLKLYLDDESTILIRKSGTEPLLRIYLESGKEEKICEFKQIIKDLV